VFQSLKAQLNAASAMASSQELEILQAQNREIILSESLAKAHRENSELNREYQRSYSALSHKSTSETKKLKTKIRELELEVFNSITLICRITK
jgi:hypothetical protein